MNQSKELLRQQLELLAEHSEGATEQELPNLSAAMCEIYDRLIQEGVGRSLFRSAIILVTLSNLLVSMVVMELAVALNLPQAAPALLSFVIQGGLHNGKINGTYRKRRSYQCSVVFRSRA